MLWGSLFNAVSSDSSVRPTYSLRMTVVTFRSNPDIERLLDQLAADGETRSDTIRRALIDAARLREREAMRAEALAAAADPEDLAESRAVRLFMDEQRAW